MLQRLSEIAECIHSLVDSLTAEHVDAKFESTLILLLEVHDLFSPVKISAHCRLRVALSTM
jgi:hypothetical protein